MSCVAKKKEGRPPLRANRGAARKKSAKKKEQLCGRASSMQPAGRQAHQPLQLGHAPHGFRQQHVALTDHQNLSCAERQKEGTR